MAIGVLVGMCVGLCEIWAFKVGTQFVYPRNLFFFSHSQAFSSHMIMICVLNYPYYSQPPTAYPHVVSPVVNVRRGNNFSLLLRVHFFGLNLSEN